MSYIPLHLHTEYSVLDGLSTPAEYMERAVELGMSHVSVTDHGTMSGHRDFQKAAAAAGITPILGVEAYISATDRFDKRANTKRSDGTSAYNHITLLSLNQNGLENLSKLSEIGWTEGYYHKPRIDLDVLSDFSDDIVVLSGCLNGLICKSIENEDIDTARRIALHLKSVFGERFFIEVQSHNPKEMNHALLDIADSLNIPPVMASDCHYSKPEDLWAEEAMLILSTNPKRNPEAELGKIKSMEMLDKFNYLYPDRKMSFQDIQLFLRSLTQEQEMFKAQGIDRADIFDNTYNIANMVGEYKMYEGLSLLPEPKVDANTRLRSLCNGGLKRRNVDIEPYHKRLEIELGIIQAKDFSPYFLVVGDMVSWAKKNDIMVGPGRGSAAGSLVCYLLGITEIDPLKHNLLFARFINEERNDWPDIDVDIMDTRRNEVKEYLTRKFKHVASISTFTYFKDKGVVRDASRVLGVPLADVNRVLKTIDTYDDFVSGPDSKWFRDQYPDVQKIANYLRGRIRSVGMHAAGVIVSKEPINKYAPMETRNDTSSLVSGRIPVVAYDMNQAEEIGLIKIDLLGLKTLSVINTAVTQIKQLHGVDIDLLNLDMEDEKVYNDLSNGFTKGVFQAEAAPYTNLLTRMGVDNFGQLVASNALVRPGAMNTVGGDYIARKQGRASVPRVHEIYDRITAETYGLPIYQEQVMLLCNELAGMSWSDADKIRKIIGKKKDVSEFEQYKTKFIEGASDKINPKMAEKLWHDFEAHSNYSFNKSHAVAYSTLSYWAAWLKHYYPLEFMFAILSNEQDKDSRTDYLIEAKRLGIKILLPHVNRSEAGFSIKDGAIVFGLSDVKYLSDKLSPRLIAMRPFHSYAEMREKALQKGTGINSRAIDSLDKIGAAEFPDNPLRGDESDHFYEYLGIPNFTSDAITPQIQKSLGKLQDFDEQGNFIYYVMVKSIKRGKGWSRVEIVDGSGSAGVFHNENTQIIPGKMYLMLVSNNRVARYIDAEDLKDVDNDPFVRYLSVKEINIPHDRKVVIAFSSRKTKAGKFMASVTLANKEKELFTALVFPKQYPRALGKLREGQVVHVEMKRLEDDTLFIHKIN